MAVLKVLVGLSILVSIGWVAAEPSFEAILAAIGSIVAWLSLYTYDYANRTIRQRQKVQDGSQGLQAGGDIRINANDRDASDD